MSICVVVADSSRARIFLAETGQDPLIEDRILDHPESRLKEQELVTDGYGSENDTGGYGKHSMGHEREAHQHEAEIFATDICAEIAKIRRIGDLRRIYLVAPPKFLGLLRSALNPQCHELLAGEVNKDLVSHTLEAIRSHLPRRL